ncbi:MAG: hypothetical protein H0W43_14065 [Chthoniobacterales bacterium]|nr:hypothetical protein [Chthoniobacterales bacterium]
MARKARVEFAGAVFRLTPVVVRLIPSAIWPALLVIPTLPSAIRFDAAGRPVDAGEAGGAGCDVPELLPA